jgi:transcriptional regulator with XRE-family HTH domain
MDSLSDIAGLLRAARALLKLRQDQLAKRAKVSRQMVARIESVGKGIPFEAIEKVRSALEKEGIDFFPATTTHGPAIALRKGAQKKSAESA